MPAANGADGRWCRYAMGVGLHCSPDSCRLGAPFQLHQLDNLIGKSTGIDIAWDYGDSPAALYVWCLACRAVCNHQQGNH